MVSTAFNAAAIGWCYQAFAMISIVWMMYCLCAPMAQQSLKHTLPLKTERAFQTHIWKSLLKFAFACCFIAERHLFLHLKGGGFFSYSPCIRYVFAACSWGLFPICHDYSSTLPLKCLQIWMCFSLCFIFRNTVCYSFCLRLPNFWLFCICCSCNEDWVQVTIAQLYFTVLKEQGAEILIDVSHKSFSHRATDCSLCCTHHPKHDLTRKTAHLKIH